MVHSRMRRGTHGRLPLALFALSTLAGASLAAGPKNNSTAPDHVDVAVQASQDVPRIIVQETDAEEASDASAKRRKASRREPVTRNRKGAGAGRWALAGLRVFKASLESDHRPAKHFWER